MYYENKIESLKEIFGANSIKLNPDSLIIDDHCYPIVNDVIIVDDSAKASANFAPDIQATFGAEWQSYASINSDNETEFKQYFDLVDLESLKNFRVCDLGCGNGRWSYFLQNKCRELVLVDFSEAIFVARKNLSNADNTIFIKCDLTKLPFKDNFADFLFCLGVLHHLPTDCLKEVVNLKKFAGRILIYLYYNLDNRPVYFRYLLKLVTSIRLQTSKIQTEKTRLMLAKIGTYCVYLPFILLGKLLKPFGIQVPLYEAYHDKDLKRIEQDVYDRFFTRIEQRVSRNQILELSSTFKSIKISDNPPYHHFICIT